MEHVAELGARRVQAREREHRAHVEQDFLVQRLVVEGRVEQVGEEVALRLRIDPPVGELLAPEDAHLAERLAHVLGALGVAAEAAEEHVDPLGELLGVGHRHADHAQERRGRVQQREVLDEVAPPLGDERLDEAPAQLAHHRGRRLHRLRREPRVQDAAVLDVIRRVDLRRHEPVDRVRLPRRDRLAGEDLRGLVDVLDGLVAREHPVAAAGVLVVEVRAALAQVVGELPVVTEVAGRGEVLVHHRATGDLRSLHLGDRACFHGFGLPCAFAGLGFRRRRARRPAPRGSPAATR